jgi:hypothetical protein
MTFWEAIANAVLIGAKIKDDSVDPAVEYTITEVRLEPVTKQVSYYVAELAQPIIGLQNDAFLIDSDNISLTTVQPPVNLNSPSKGLQGKKRKR